MSSRNEAKWKWGDEPPRRSDSTVARLAGGIASDTRTAHALRLVLRKAWGRGYVAAAYDLGAFEGCRPTLVNTVTTLAKELPDCTTTVRTALVEAWSDGYATASEDAGFDLGRSA